ncbi:MAG: HD domain-containing protein [Chloroflexi bacterium]|nr:MAG: HD domain-containing protein [Chloroflexota bacterium]
MHLAGEWARHLHPSLHVSCPDTPSLQLVEETMRMAGLLHDVGHGPFGHFFDENYLDTWGIDHEVIGRALITGPLADLIGEVGASPGADFERGERIDPRWVAFLISSTDLEGFEPPPWLAVLRPALVGAFSALYIFLNSRLYLYHQVYFHRTVRRIDLQLREVFRPTLELLLGGNPLERLDRYQALTEWSLLSDVDRWAHGHGDANQRELGQAWADVVARKLKWKLIYQGHTDARDIPSAALSVTRDQFASELRTRLPANLRDIVFEVDVAAQESRAFNPMTETSDILFYEPLEDRYRQSRVLDLFRRLPVRMALFRIFARDETHRRELIKAANEVLGLTG